MTAILEASELQSWMREQRRFTLLDVLPDEYFQAQRLPGARRASVYEVTFLNQVEALGISPNEPVVLYGAGNGSLDSAVAAEKLERAGFRRIYDFRGGRAGVGAVRRDVRGRWLAALRSTRAGEPEIFIKPG